MRPIVTAPIRIPRIFVTGCERRCLEFLKTQGYQPPRLQPTTRIKTNDLEFSYCKTVLLNSEQGKASLFGCEAGLFLANGTNQPQVDLTRIALPIIAVPPVQPGNPENFLTEVLQYLKAMLTHSNEIKHDEQTDLHSIYRDTFGRLNSTCKIQKWWQRCHTRQLVKTAYTPNQAFLLSHEQVSKDAALAYFKGPALRGNKKGVYFPDYQQNNPYNQFIFNNIADEYRPRFLHADWQDASRRCFDSVLAYETLVAETSAPSSIIPILRQIKEACFAVADQNDIGDAVRAIERGENHPDLQQSKTFIDFFNARLAVEMKFSRTNPALFEVLFYSLLIWISCMETQLLMPVYKHVIAKPEVKGRHFVNDVNTLCSNRLGTFKNSDFLPEHLRQIFGLPRSFIRSADFSQSVFVDRAPNGPLREPIYTNSLLCQNGISGLAVALVSLLMQRTTINPLALIQGQELRLMRILLSALVLGVGGHNYAEMISAINLPDVEIIIQREQQQLQPGSLAFYKAIDGDKIYDSFSEQPLLQAINQARVYELLRRQNLASRAAVTSNCSLGENRG